MKHYMHLIGIQERLFGNSKPKPTPSRHHTLTKMAQLYIHGTVHYTLQMEKYSLITASIHLVNLSLEDGDGLRSMLRQAKKYGTYRDVVLTAESSKELWLMAV